jgi:hypothetical protein
MRLLDVFSAAVYLFVGITFLVGSRVLFRLRNGDHFDFDLPVPWMRSRRDDQSGEAHSPTLKSGLKRHAAADIG